MKRCGWTPDVPDHRDFSYGRSLTKKLPTRLDLRNQFPAVWNQGNLGSCTAQAIAAHCQYNDIKDADIDIIMPSRLFIYYNERAMEGTVESDAGAQIRNGIKVLAKWGYCPENLWPYKIQKFREKPHTQCYKKARKEKITHYYRIKHQLKDLKSCLAEGFPFVFGFSLYESVDGPKVIRTGQIPLPKRNEKMDGGHAVLAVGYDDRKKVFFFRNSWGPSWGEKGYGAIPYDFILNNDLTDDFWTIRFSQETK